jgi:hypothetical protein
MCPNKAFQEGNCFPHSVHALAFSEKRELGFLVVAAATEAEAAEAEAAGIAGKGDDGLGRGAAVVTTAGVSGAEAVEESLSGEALRASGWR